MRTHDSRHPRARSAASARLALCLGLLAAGALGLPAAAAAQGVWRLTVAVVDGSTPPPGVEMTYRARCFYYPPEPDVPADDWGYASDGINWWRWCGVDLPIGPEVEINVEQNPYAIRAYPTQAALYYDSANYTGCLSSPVCDNETQIGLGATQGSIYGYVRLASDQTPLPDVTVVAYDTNGVQRGIAQTDSDGRYEFVKPNAQPHEVENHWALPLQHFLPPGEAVYRDFRVFAAVVGAGTPPYMATEPTTRAFSSFSMGRKDFNIGSPEGDEQDPNEDTAEEETPTYRPPPCPPDDECCNAPSAEGKPVRLTTGTVYFSQVDAVINGIGRKLEFARRYNSRRALNNLAGAFGRGWEHSLEKSITMVVPNHLLRLNAGTGGPLYFQDSDRDGSFEPSIPITERSSIVASGGGYTREFDFGGTETYDANGRLIAQTDRVGNVTSLNRDVDGRLTAVVLPGGRTLYLDYAGDRVSQLRGPSSSLATYSYTPEGLLERVDYASGSGYVFTYDGEGQVLTVADLSGRVIESHSYASGKALTSEIAGGQERLSFNYTAGSTVVADATGRTTTYGITQAAGLKRVYSASTACTACGQNQSGSWGYDARGRAYLRQWVDEDGVRHVVNYTYDANDNVSGVSLPLGRTASYTHDDEGRMLTRVAPDGALTSWIQGPAGPLSITDPLDRTTTIGYSPAGQVSSVTNPEGEATTLTYDASGDLASVTDPLMHTASFGYDDLGRRTSVTDPLGRTTAIAYDSAGNVTRITVHDLTHTDFTYDAGGRRDSLTDPAGRVTRYGYDAYGRLKTIQDPAGATTRYDYDAMSRISAITDAREKPTGFAYDTLGRMIQMTYPGGATESYTFDAMGRMKTKTDPRGILTTYQYDAADRLTSMSFSDGTPARSFTYDMAGRLLSAQNGTDTLTWTYDAAGQRLAEASSRNGTTVAYTYDDAGRRLTVALDGSVVASYVYDDASRLTTLASGGEAFSFSYDAASQRTAVTAPNGVETSYLYDPLGRLTNLLAVLNGTTPIAAFMYTYNTTGNRTTKATAEYSEAYSYDALDRLIGVERSGTLTGRSFYRYDTVGNRTTTQIDSMVASALHNERNQIVSSSGGGPLRVRGALDEPANVLVNGQPAQMLNGNTFEATIAAVPGTNSFSVEATDGSGNVKIQTYEVDVPAQAVSYSYDPSGNLTQKVEGAETWAYEWDAENQLKRVTRNGLEYVRFSYDPLGRRIEVLPSEPNSLATGMVYDGEDILHVDGGTTFGRTTTLYTHGPGIDEPLMSQDTRFDFRGNSFPGLRRYYHADGLGSIVKVTGLAGATIGEARYDAWGNVESGNLRPHAFTGREWDPETGLYYYRARYYDPTLGRFLSEDPIGAASGDANFYAYVFNSPVNFRDPSGLAPGDQRYGLPNEFWRWAHRNAMQATDLTKTEAMEAYKEWKRLGQPGPDSKGKYGPRGGRGGATPRAPLIIMLSPCLLPNPFWGIDPATGECKPTPNSCGGS